MLAVSLPEIGFKWMKNLGDGQVAAIDTARGGIIDAFAGTFTRCPTAGRVDVRHRSTEYEFGSYATIVNTSNGRDPRSNTRIVAVTTNRYGLQVTNSGDRVFVHDGHICFGVGWDNGRRRFSGWGLTFDRSLRELRCAQKSMKPFPADDLPAYKQKVVSPQVTTPGQWTIAGDGSAYRCLPSLTGLSVTHHTADKLDGRWLFTLPGIFSSGQFLAMSPDGRECMVWTVGPTGRQLTRVDVSGRVLAAEYDLFPAGHSDKTVQSVLGDYSPDGATFAILATFRAGPSSATTELRVMDVGE